MANAMRYAYKATGVPIIVSEHGANTPDDCIRASFIPAALAELKVAMDEGVPVKGYMHRSLLDNFEWIFGYSAQLGLCTVDRTTFQRTPKPSAAFYSAIAAQRPIGFCRAKSHQCVIGGKAPSPALLAWPDYPNQAPHDPSRFNSSPEVIRPVVMMYVKFPLCMAIASATVERLRAA
ncbi:MAG: family 1 glycosylhydrolase [Caulobacteraceae bacterium]